MLPVSLRFYISIAPPYLDPRTHTKGRKKNEEKKNKEKKPKTIS